MLTRMKTSSDIADGFGSDETNEEPRTREHETFEDARE